MKTFAAYYDNEIRMKSSSGGVFTALAKGFDVVYGVAMDETNHFAEFVRTENNFEKLRGSKYLQASIGETYKCVKADLDRGKRVLFSGTACQVNGLHFYLRKSYANLCLIDVVCHGVPTVKMWEKYVGKRRIVSVAFRAKDAGWRDYGMRLNDVFIPSYRNKYMQLYLTNNALRPSCYNCVYKQNKQSDITIGDFWGIHHIDPSMDDDKGISMVVLRTKNGEEMFKENIKDFKYKEIDYLEAVKYNPLEIDSVICPQTRGQFFEDIGKLSFEALYKKYVNITLAVRVKGALKYMLKRIM